MWDEVGRKWLGATKETSPVKPRQELTHCAVLGGGRTGHRVTRPQGGLGESACLNCQVTTLGDNGGHHSYPHIPEAETPEGAPHSFVADFHPQ